MQQQYINSDAFHFPAESFVCITPVSIPSLPHSLLIDTSLNAARILLPPPYEQQIIHHYHNLNHLGIKATR